MTKPAADAAETASHISDYPELEVRELPSGKFSVVNHRHEPAHRYVVDLEPASCTCEDWRYRKDSDPAICKHFQAAHEAAPVTHDLDHRVALQVLKQYHDGAQAASDGATDEAVQAAVDEQEAAQRRAGGADNRPEDAAAPDDEQAQHAVRNWLEDEEVSLDHITVYPGEHGSDPGICIEPDNQEMQDKEYNWFKEVVNGPDASDVHLGFRDDGCPTCGVADDAFFYFLDMHDVQGVTG